jgi:hypothetical protein
MRSPGDKKQLRRARQQAIGTVGIVVDILAKLCCRGECRLPRFEVADESLAEWAYITYARAFWRQVRRTLGILRENRGQSAAAERPVSQRAAV